MGSMRRSISHQRLHMGCSSSTTKPLPIKPTHQPTHPLTNITPLSTVLRRLPLPLPFNLPLPHRHPKGLRLHRRSHLRLRPALQPPLDNPDPRNRAAPRNDVRLPAHVRGFHRSLLRHRPLALVPLAGRRRRHRLGGDFHPQRASPPAVVPAAQESSGWDRECWERVWGACFCVRDGCYDSTTFACLGAADYGVCLFGGESARDGSDP